MTMFSQTMPQSLGLAPERYFMEKHLPVTLLLITIANLKHGHLPHGPPSTCHIPLLPNQTHLNFFASQNPADFLGEEKHIFWKMRDWIFPSGFGLINIKEWQQFWFTDKEKNTTPISWAILESLFYLVKGSYENYTRVVSALVSLKHFGTLQSQELNQRDCPIAVLSLCPNRCIRECLPKRQKTVHFWSASGCHLAREVAWWKWYVKTQTKQNLMWISECWIFPAICRLSKILGLGNVF